MPYQRLCAYDMCARADSSDDTPMCVWMLALARTCKEVGVIVNWMDSPILVAQCQGKHISDVTSVSASRLWFDFLVTLVVTQFYLTIVCGHTANLTQL